MEQSINKAATSERLLRAEDQLSKTEIKFIAPALYLIAFTVFAIQVNKYLYN